MWSPVGYRSLYEIRGYLQTLAFRTLPASTAARQLEAEGENDSEEAENTRAFALGAWGFNSFIEDKKDALFAFGPNQQIVKVASVVVDAAKFYNGPFPEKTAQQNLMLEHIRDRFLHMDPELLAVEAERNLPLQAMLGVEKQAEALRPLNGYIVCVSWTEGSEIETLLDYISLVPVMGRPQGRPNKVNDLREAVSRAFPDGVGDRPLKDVAAEVRRAGVFTKAFSDTTLLRAMGRRD